MGLILAFIIAVYKLAFIIGLVYLIGMGLIIILTKK